MLVCEHCAQPHSDSHRYCPQTGKLLAPQRFFPAGTLIGGKYRLGELLGAGGIAAVFCATHAMLNKRMAVKLMLPELSADREMAARMAREAQAASATGHPNIALVTDMGWSEQGSMYIVMELLVGRTLTTLLRQEAPLSIARAARLGCQLLSGLAAVHAQGIIHRDIKPDNLMVLAADHSEDERLKILDFGISKFLDDDQRCQALTSTGMILGTPFYMSPEQARGSRDVDARADIYAAGGILYSMLSGRRPLDASDHASMLTVIREGTVTPPSHHVPSIPPELDAMVLQALARAPAARFADAETFRRALEPYIDCDERQATALDHPPAAPPALPSSAGHAPAEIVSESLELLSLVDIDQRQQAAHQREERPPEPAAPPPPDVTVPDAFFAPPTDEEAALELDTSAVQRSQQAVEAGKLQQDQLEHPLTSLQGAEAARARQLARTVRLALGGLGGVVVLVALLFVFDLWPGGDDATGSGGTNGSQRADPASVLLLVQTEPRDARVLVDGVQQVSGSIQLPRSGATFTVRVERQGYVSQTLQLTADRTQTVRVALRRRPGRFE